MKAPIVRLHNGPALGEREGREREREGGREDEGVGGQGRGERREGGREGEGEGRGREGEGERGTERRGGIGRGEGEIEIERGKVREREIERESGREREGGREKTRRGSQKASSATDVECTYIKSLQRNIDSRNQCSQLHIQNQFNYRKYSLLAGSPLHAHAKKCERGKGGEGEPA